MRPFIRGIEDYQYEVRWRSDLSRCPRCGLVSQDPPVQPHQIASLYPANYSYHGTQAHEARIHVALQKKLVRRAGLTLASCLPAGGTLLEVGCGDGRVLQEIAAIRPDVQLVGVDIQEVHHPPIPHYTFHQGQLESVVLEPGSADVVYCSRLLEHVADPAMFLSACRRILKPGGLLRGVTPDHRSVDRFVFGKYWGGYHYPRHTFVFDHRNLRALLTQAGFVAVHIRGSYGWWYQSLANRFLSPPARRERGVAFVGVTAFFLPFDVLVNLFSIHGSMTFDATLPTQTGAAFSPNPRGIPRRISRCWAWRQFSRL